MIDVEMNATICMLRFQWISGRLKTEHGVLRPTERSCHATHRDLDKSD